MDKQICIHFQKITSHVSSFQKGHCWKYNTLVALNDCTNCEGKHSCYGYRSKN